MDPKTILILAIATGFGALVGFAIAALLGTTGYADSYMDGYRDGTRDATTPTDRLPPAP